MKQKITLSMAVVAMFVLPSLHTTAQNLLKQSFDTSAAFQMSSSPYKGWTDTVYDRGSYGCCAAVDHWTWGPPPDPNAMSCPFCYYLSYAGGSNSYFYPSPPPNSGSGYAMMNEFYRLYGGAYGYSVSKIEMRSPSVTLPSSGKTVVSYWVYLSSGYEGLYGNSYWDSLQVWVNTGPRSYGTNAYKLRKVTVDSFTSSSSSTWYWYHYADTIPTSFNGQTVNIMFTGYNAYYYEGSDIYIDEFSLDHYYQCGGVPKSGTVAGPSHICRTKQFLLTDTGGVSYIGMTYQWQSRPSGTTAWTNLATTNPLSTNIPSSSGTTEYRCYMTCTASGFTDTTPVWTVVADTFFRCYCAIPTTNIVIGGNTPPTVDSVAMTGTTLKNITHTAFSGFYGQVYDSVTQTRAVVSRGGTYTLAVKYGGSSSYGMAWIDWNQSGVFNDSASSEYYTLNSSLAASGTVTFTVPITARTGRTGLRIRSSSIYSPSAGYACTNFGTSSGAGETVDYVITVVNPPTVDLGVTAITSPPITVTYCPNKADTINATILNYGSTPQSNFYIYAKYVGAVTDSIFTVYTGTLAPLASANIYIGTIDPPLGGKYSLQVYTVTTGDMVGLNDTMYSTFNLYPLPADPVVKSDTVCPGGTAHIAVTPARYQNFKWYRVPTGGSAFDSISYTKSVVAPAADSTYYIVATDSTTKCVGNRVPVTAAMRPKPVVDLGPDSTLCESPTFFLDAGNPGGSKYAWNTGDTTRKINPRLSGTYYVNVFHYCTVTDSVNLVINPLPHADGIDYVRTGNTYAFGIAGVLYTDSYKWFFGDGTTSTDPTPIHTYSTTGPYSVMVVLYNACGADTISWGVPNKVNNLGQPSGSLSLYPNPANNTLTISAGDNTTLKQIIIVNAIGSVVYSKDIDNEKTINIDVSVLPQGQYILRANTNQGISSKLFDVLHR